MRKRAKIKLPQYVILKGGSWHVRRAFPTSRRDEKGHVIYEQITRKCEPETEDRARELSILIEQEYRRILEGLPDAATVLALISDVLATKKHSVGRGAYENYVFYRDRYLAKSELGRMALTEVKTKHVERLYAELLTSGVSPSMIRKLHRFLKMAFKKAVVHEAIARNPADGVELPAVTRHEQKPFTEKQAMAFMAECRKTDDHIILEFALETGFREQEYIATRWTDLHLDLCMVDVKQAIIFHRKGGGFTVKEPKTNTSKRTIDFSPEMRDRLLQHKQRQTEYLDSLRRELTRPALLGHMQRQGQNYQKRQLRHKTIREILANFDKYNLVFPALNGKPQNPVNLSKRGYAEVVKAIGLERREYPLNSLRHSHASIMANKVPPKRLQVRMGHSNISTTLTYYIHVVDDNDMRPSSLMADMLYQRPERSNVVRMK
jgi:integrase